MFMYNWNKQQLTLPVTYLCETSGLHIAVDTPVSSRLLFCVVHSFEFLCLIKQRTMKTLWRYGCTNPRIRDLGTNEGEWFLCNTIYPLSKKLDVSQSGSGCGGINRCCCYFSESKGRVTRSVFFFFFKNIDLLLWDVQMFTWIFHQNCSRYQFTWDFWLNLGNWSLLRWNSIYA